MTTVNITHSFVVVFASQPIDVCNCSVGRKKQPIVKYSPVVYVDNSRLGSLIRSLAGSECSATFCLLGCLPPSKKGDKVLLITSDDNVCANQDL